MLTDPKPWAARILRDASHLKGDDRAKRHLAIIETYLEAYAAECIAATAAVNVDRLP